LHALTLSPLAINVLPPRLVIVYHPYSPVDASIGALVTKNPTIVVQSTGDRVSELSIKTGFQYGMQ
jgi:hypothetical protein